MWLLDKDWKPGYCAYHRHPGQVRIRVSLWCRVQRVEGAFVEPPRRLRTVLDYVGEHGVRQTLRKIRSRLAESGRNRKYVAFGCGEIVETEPGAVLRMGDAVAFLAPSHPACVDEVCLAAGLVRRLPPGVRMPGLEGAVLEGEWEAAELPWAELAGWSDFSGIALDLQLVDRLFEASLPRLAAGELADASTARRLGPEPAVGAPSREDGDRPSAVLYGLGHYAKNVVLPRVARHVTLACIHEIDPSQIGEARRHRVRLRTSAYPESGETYDVHLVCGFHHTHAPIAVEALKRGAAAVVEKPLATTREQLEKLLSALETGSGRLFAAFQRRYTVFGEYARSDLQIEPGTPVHYQAVVYEIPLPKRHWYRWPSSRSRIVSNGCHWIDHFLFLNHYSSPVSVAVSRRVNGDVNVMMDLENGASMSLVITEHGSSRLGVRENVELRAGSRTAVIVDQRHYRAESSRRRLRRVSIGASEPYDRMYGEIGRRIAAGEPGDSPRSVRVSTAAVLEADARLAAL